MGEPAEGAKSILNECRRFISLHGMFSTFIDVQNERKSKKQQFPVLLLNARVCYHTKLVVNLLRVKSRAN